jgi:hypothetical protein
LASTRSQFGAQYVYSQRNQTNNAIGAASGDLQGLLTFSNLTHSTGNAFADFLVENANARRAFRRDSFRVLPRIPRSGRYYQRFQIAEPYFQDDWRGNASTYAESRPARQPVWHL